MVYTSTTLFTFYKCLYLQRNADLPNRFCVGLTPITFLFPVAPRHSRGINACRLKTDRLVPSKHVKLDHPRPGRKTPSEKRFAGGPIVAWDLVLAVCKLALNDTCSSDIVKETSACACHLPKGNSKICWYMYSCAGWSESKCRIVGTFK